MKKSHFTEEQIIGVLKEAEAGVLMADLFRKHGVSQQTFYRWKAKYGGLEVSEAPTAGVGRREPAASMPWRCRCWTCGRSRRCYQESS